MTWPDHVVPPGAEDLKRVKNGTRTIGFERTFLEYAENSIFRIILLRLLADTRKLFRIQLL